MENIIRKDNRPYWLKNISTRFVKFYVKNYLKPQFSYLGRGGTFFKPWQIEIFGDNITIDDFPTLISASDAKIKLTSWNIGGHSAKLSIGKYSLITPGVRILAAKEIDIGDSCMIANGVYISDADWHDIYDRSEPVGSCKKIKIKNNVWIGDGAKICKGVTIGENSIIAAGAVLTKNVPPNCVFAGNPAKFVKALNEKNFITRADFYSDPKKLAEEFTILDKFSLRDNTFFGWIKSKLFPNNSN